jgi:hypothetical protein
MACEKVKNSKLLEMAGKIFTELEWEIKFKLLVDDFVFSQGRLWGPNQFF